MNTTSISASVQFSIHSLRQVSGIPIYCLNKKGKAMQDLANILLAQRGYILASSKELKSMFPSLYTCPDWSLDDEKVVWSIGYSRRTFSRRVDVFFVPVHGFNN